VLACALKRIAAFALVAGCASATVVDTDSAMVAWTNDRACRVDDDCVMVDDCCSCATGGGRVGVNKTARTAVEARRREACSTDDSVASPEARGVTPVKCSNVAKTEGSCAAGARAACRAGVCRIVK
jgi:hypothetical protein